MISPKDVSSKEESWKQHKRSAPRFGLIAIAWRVIGKDDLGTRRPRNIKHRFTPFNHPRKLEKSAIRMDRNHLDQPDGMVTVVTSMICESLGFPSLIGRSC